MNSTTTQPSGSALPGSKDNAPLSRTSVSRETGGAEEAAEQKQAVTALSEDGLAAFLADSGQPAFRAKQLWQWLWVHNTSSFDEMTNLPRTLREQLAAAFRIPTVTVSARQVSSDGTRKYLITFEDGVSVETVGIPSHDGARLTVCVSTQAGCAMGCIFCATGLHGFTRNLCAFEIYRQVIAVQDDFDQRVSNVVFMGQGEPFANYGEVLRALRLLNDARTLGIGARHITVSTCGLVDGIHRFSREPEQFTLAVSLHSAVQRTRDQLMPGVRAHTLEELKHALKAYGDATKRRPTLEYALMQGVNDDDEHLLALENFCSNMLCHVNLIPLNPVLAANDPAAMRPSARMQHFHDALSRRGIETSVRSSRGQDIDGACGQLKQRLDGQP